MRRGLLPLVAALLLLPGCHELWGGSHASGGVSSDAEANVRAAIPALEAWYADNGTYAGATLALIQDRYDASVKDVQFVGTLDHETYCVESTVGGETYSKNGPASPISPGAC
jgi:hypothetical protein